MSDSLEDRMAKQFMHLVAGVAALIGFGAMGHDAVVEHIVSTTGDYSYRKNAFGFFYNPTNPAILRGMNPLTLSQEELDQLKRQPLPKPSEYSCSHCKE